MPWTALGLMFTAGQNPYAALFLLAVLARSDETPLTLQPSFGFLASPAAIAMLFVLAGAQVFADKHPRWSRAEALVSAGTRPLCAVVAVLSLLDPASAATWLWAALAVAVALGSHFFRVRLRRQLAATMAGMGYFLASLALDSAALVTGLLAVIAPVGGAALGAVMFGGAAGLSLRMLFRNQAGDTNGATG